MTGVTCPRCGRTSRHPDDVRAGYCGACHDFTHGPVVLEATDPLADLMAAMKLVESEPAAPRTVRVAPDVLETLRRDRGVLPSWLPTSTSSLYVRLDVDPDLAPGTFEVDR